MLVERIIALSALASKDATRPQLEGVWLSVDTQKKSHSLPSLLLEVTDGHKASREWVEDAGSLHFDGHFFIPLEKIAILKLLQKAHKYTAVPISYDVEADLLSIGENSEVVLKRPSAKVPPFASIYMRQSATAMKTIASIKDGSEVFVDIPETTVIGLNAEYLLQIAKALKSGKLPVVKLIIKDATSPITVVVGERDAVLMPCRV